MAISARRLIAAGGCAVALAAAPALAAFTIPSTALAAGCPGGETEDTYTGECVPDLVPNSPFVSIAGNPNLPAVELPGGGGAIPCTGSNSGQCIGLAEIHQAQGPEPIPRSTVGSSPTVTGHNG